jgi:hypothetical protein
LLSNFNAIFVEKGEAMREGVEEGEVRREGEKTKKMKKENKVR